MKRCTKCQIEKPASEFYKNEKMKDGLIYWCKGCVKQYQLDNKKRISEYKKQYCSGNKEKIARQKKQYRFDNKEEISRQKKQYRFDNKEEISRQKKQYRLDNKEKIVLYFKQFYQDNKERTAKQRKQYRFNNKEKAAKYQKQYLYTEQGKNVKKRSDYKRRTLKYNGIYEVFDPKEIFERDGWICQLCGKKTRPDYKNSYHSLYPNLDHIIPLSKGGSHTRLNTQCSCHQCNMKKGANGGGDQLRMFG